MNFFQRSLEKFAESLTSFLCGGLVFIIPSCSSSLNTEIGSSPQTNMEIMVRLTQKIAQALAQNSGIRLGDTCIVAFARTENLEFIEHSFIKSFQELPLFVRTNSATSDRLISFDIQPSQTDVVYEKTFRDGFFGEKRVVRLVTIELSSKVVKQPQGNLLFAGMSKEQFRDTVLISSLEQLESPIIKATQASLPPESFFDRFVEPLVVLTATGVLIYLFYTVRS